MSITLQSMNVDKQVQRLEEMADVLVTVVQDNPGIQTRDALAEAADKLHLPVSQLQYALTFAKSERRLRTNGLTAQVFA